MFRLEVLQNQWLILAFFGGIAVVLALWSYYLAYWRERAEGRSEGKQTLRELFQAIPVFLILTYVFTLVFLIVYTAVMVIHPPNW